MIIRRFNSIQFGSKANVDKWIKSVSKKTSTPESVSKYNQLSSLINYYNKDATAYKDLNIDWEKYSSEILTDDLVNKVKSNYEELNSSNYNVEKIANEILTEPSEEYKNITKELIYHNQLWKDYYIDQKMYLYQLDKVGSFHDYKMHDLCDMFDGLETEVMELVETHNYLPDSKEDIPMNAYLSMQFDWGKKIVSFYKHPTDDYKSIRGTNNIMGK